MIRNVIEDIRKGSSIGMISARFHNTLVELIIHLSCEIRTETGLEKVVLAGGTFQNRYLVKKVRQKLVNKHFEVYLPSTIPVNDQGIAAGQLILGAHWRDQIKKKDHA
jgi:hydrogenase maturation protein HypF